MVTALVATAAAARAEPVSDAVGLCNLITDRTVAYIKAGDMKRAKVNRPYLEKCEPILKAHRDDQAARMLDAVTEVRPGTKDAPGRLERRQSIPR